MKTYQPSSDPYFRNPADDPRLPPVAEPGVTKDGKPKVALTMSFMTTQGFTALRQGRPIEEIDPAEIPRLRHLLREMRQAAADARRQANGEFGEPGPAAP